MCSHFFPAWYLGTWPDKRIILASYEASFAESWGRKARDVIEEVGMEFWGVKTRDDSSAAARWDIAGHVGGMITAGVGGAVTGRGANVLLIDDPVKNADEANSLTYRQKTWDWFQSTAYTRLEPNGAIVLIQTRWHADDLGGRILQEVEHGGEEWECINLPAIAQEGDALGREPGSALWPERYGVEQLDGIRQAVGAYVWGALYQQSPITREGGMFQREWFPVVDVPPANLSKVVRYWDMAATEPTKGRDPDYTVGMKVARNGDGHYYVLDMRRDRLSPQGNEALIKQTTQLDGVETEAWMEEEGGSSGKSIIDYYIRLLAGYAFRGIRSTGDKQARANPVSSQAAAGNIRLVRGPWVNEFLDEIEAFPHGSHDDVVDGLSGAVKMLWTEPDYQEYVTTEDMFGPDIAVKLGDY